MITLVAGLDTVRAWIVRTLTGEQGQGLVEYALILVLVSVAVVVALGAITEPVWDMFVRVLCEFDQAGAPCP